MRDRCTVKKTYALKPRNKTKTEQDIGTPADFFKVAHKEFNFAWDLAASPDNAKCRKFLTKESGSGGGTTKGGGSLEVDWHKLAPGRWLWLNPPFNAIPKWIGKCHEEAEKGAKIAILVPAANTVWWRTFVWGRRQCRLLAERLVFDYMVKKMITVGKRRKWSKVRNTDPYPKDCQLIIFDKSQDRDQIRMVIWHWTHGVINCWDDHGNTLPIRKISVEEWLR
jgi:phage N-6-adenine-methyltransferase